MSEIKRKRGERTAVCPATGKVGYYSQDDAELALTHARAKAQASGKAAPRRIYVCEACGLRHLTGRRRWFPSMPKENPAADGSE